MFGTTRKLEKRLRGLGVDYSDAKSRYTVNLPEKQHPGDEYLRELADTIAKHAEKKTPFFGDKQNIDVRVQGGSPSYFARFIEERVSEFEGRGDLIKMTTYSEMLSSIYTNHQLQPTW